MNKSFSTSLALTAAALFISGCGKSGESAPPATAASAGGDSQVKCLGINECKGKGACGGPSGNICAGQNECKGKGWIKVAKAECQELGGQILE